MKPVELIRQNIDRILRRKKWKRCDLAKALGTSDSHVSQIMTGARWGQRIEWATYEKVCRALEIDDLELIKLLPYANEAVIRRLEVAVAELPVKDDVALVFQFLAVLKHKNYLDPEYLQILTGTLKLLQKELVEKLGLEVFDPLAITGAQEERRENTPWTSN
jgi:DNA-binding Xre family transcriptional regulator